MLRPHSYRVCLSTGFKEAGKTGSKPALLKLLQKSPFGTNFR
jgi:hypothetical protein